MLTRIKELARNRIDFAFETTLASRSFAPWLRELVVAGYQLNLVFLWLPSADLAVARVADRVRLGGHEVPEETIRRRYRAGIVNFVHLYRPIATERRVYDNSESPTMRLIARGHGLTMTELCQHENWQRLTSIGSIQ